MIGEPLEGMQDITCLVSLMSLELLMHRFKYFQIPNNRKLVNIIIHKISIRMT